MANNQHVVRHENGKWAIRGEENEKVTQYFSTQKEAAARAREIAQNQEVELLIHGVDGKIRERHSYGNDPYPPLG